LYSYDGSLNLIKITSVFR